MYDEPFGDSSALPTWLICREARQHVKVALTGDGGDEVFGGYERYRALQLGTGLCPAGLRPGPCGRGDGQADGPPPRAKPAEAAGPFRRRLAYPPALQYFMYRRLFGPQDLDRLLSDQALSEVDVEAPARWFCDLYQAGEADDEVLAAQRHDLATYLPDDLLVKTDIASMACSLELRAPMLQPGLVDAGAVPADLRPRSPRAGARRSCVRPLRTGCPRGSCRGPKKGFGVPLARWLRQDLREVMAECLLHPAGGVWADVPSGGVWRAW